MEHDMRILRHFGLFDKEVGRTAIIKIREISNTNVQVPGTSVRESIREEMADLNDVSNGSDDSHISDLESLETDDRDVSDLARFDKKARRTPGFELREISNTNVHAPGTSVRESIREVMADLSDVSNGSGDSHISDLLNSETDDNDVRDESYAIANLDRLLHTKFCVHPNGYDVSTKNHVCLKCKLSPDLLFMATPHLMCYSLELTCVVNAVDAEGCRRFPQSFMYMYTNKPMNTPAFIPAYDYISRDFLLTAADDLLPDDTLTLQVDVVLKATFAKSFSLKNLLKSFKFKRKNVPGFYLSLTCPVAEHLRMESRYFERLCETPMAEKDSGYANIPRDEFHNFILMLLVMYDQMIPAHRGFTVDFERILDLYRLADFYGIHRVLDTCRSWLKLICRSSEKASTISYLADTYGDHLLKGIVERANSKNDGTEVAKDGVPHKQWAMTTHVAEGSLKYFFQCLWETEEEEEVRVANVTEDVRDISNCYI